jgi:hypothetical protein
MENAFKKDNALIIFITKIIPVINVIYLVLIVMETLPIIALNVRLL